MCNVDLYYICKVRNKNMFKYKKMKFSWITVNVIFMTNISFFRENHKSLISKMKKIEQRSYYTDPWSEAIA